MTSGTGKCTVTFSQAGNAHFLAAAPVKQTTTAQKASQEITVTQAAPATAALHATFPVSATASSGLPVLIKASGACSLSGGSVTITNATGTCTVTFSQAGNANYSAAAQVKETTTARPAAPDLIVTDLTPLPGAVEPGASFPVTDTVKNQGTADAGASKTQYYLSLNTTKGGSDILLTPARSVAKLAVAGTSSGTVTLKIPTTAKLATYHVLACADDMATVAETDEGNNCRASADTVQVARPDLRATVSDPPATGAQGASFIVRETTTNHGAVPAGKSKTAYYLSRDPIKSPDDQVLSQDRSVPALQPGASSSGELDVKIPSKTPLGPHFLLACADDGADVVESDEGNNCAASTTLINVIASSNGRPDLTPYRPSGWSDQIVVAKTLGTTTDAKPLRAADTLYVDWSVRNEGSGPTTAPFRTELYVDGVLRNFWVTPSLDEKAHVSILDYPIGALPAGTHTITIKTDTTNALAEVSKNDNEYTKTITVLP